MVDWLPRAAARRPDHVAVVTPEGSLTYAELLERARGAEAPATIELPPGLDFAVALHACLLHGVPAVPIDPRLTETERAARRGAGSGSAMLVVHTSGTTGRPKPVEISAENVQASARGTAEVLGLGPQERWLCPLPLSHVGGLMVLLRSVLYATTAVLAQQDDAATIASLVPTQLARRLDAGARTGRVLLGGAPAAPELLRRARAAGIEVHETYGMTETTSAATIDGRPLPGVDVSLAADGEIIVEGPIVAGGGALRTGDLGAFDEQGRLVVTGRKTDTIVTGGENVAPAEVEAVLTAHPDVLDAAVVGRPDPEWGEALTALVVPRPGRTLEPDAVRAFCRERLAGFKVPKTVEAVERLPRTASGKLVRGQLR
jgi:o-succinylbenzoate---CoA ligase